MASATKQAKRLAQGLEIPGGDAVAGTLSGILNQNLSSPDVFTPGTSNLGQQGQSALSNLLNTSGQGRADPSFSFLQPNQVTAANLTLSDSEQARRTRLADELTQRTRDAASSRGLNRGEAGAALESRTLGRFFEDLSAQDFAKERALTAENIAFESLRQQGATTLFNQEVQAAAIRDGRENELFQRQFNTIQTALTQSNIEFNQDQTEFTTNLTAAGMPIASALQFMQLVQAGDIAGAELILTGIGIDEEARNALMGAVGGLFQGIGAVAGTVIGAKVGGAL